MGKATRIEWKLVRGTWISPRPVLPGVWRRKEGGHVVRGRAMDSRTGRLKEVTKVLPNATAKEAFDLLHEELERIRSSAAAAPSASVPFATYAVSLMERKIAARDIKSLAGRRKWGTVLQHLIADEIGEMLIDRVRPRDVQAWRDRVARKIAAGDYAPTTANTWMAVLKTIFAQATIDLELPRDPSIGLRTFDTSTHHTYTDEEPNALTAEEVRDFLACMRENYPHHFAMTYLGFATGLRPSSLRPLRRKGATPDVLWKEHVLLVRQSQTDGDEVMPCTKTGTTQRLTVPKELIDVLKWHVDTQLRPGPQQESDLLFPSETGGFRSRSVLDKPFRDVARAIGLKKTITPRAMRRSFQDLARTASVADVVTRSISGHATETMQRHYSTVSGREQREGLGRVLGLIDRNHALTRVAPSSGEVGGEDPGSVGRIVH